MIAFVFFSSKHNNVSGCSQSTYKQSRDILILIGGFRDSQSDVIFAHAHIRGRQRIG